MAYDTAETGSFALVLRSFPGHFSVCYFPGTQQEADEEQLQFNLKGSFLSFEPRLFMISITNNRTTRV